MSNYTKRLSRLQYSQLTTIQHGAYYLDYLSSYWEPNIELVCEYKHPVLLNMEDCPIDFLLEQGKEKGHCDGCAWFLGKENLTNLGCCGLLLHDT